MSCPERLILDDAARREAEGLPWRSALTRAVDDALAEAILHGTGPLAIARSGETWPEAASHHVQVVGAALATLRELQRTTPLAVRQPDRIVTALERVVDEYLPRQDEPPPAP